MSRFETQDYWLGEMRTWLHMNDLTLENWEEACSIGHVHDERREFWSKDEVILDLALTWSFFQHDDPLERNLGLPFRKNRTVLQKVAAAHGRQIKSLDEYSRVVLILVELGVIQPPMDSTRVALRENRLSLGNFAIFHILKDSGVYTSDQTYDEEAVKTIRRDIGFLNSENVEISTRVQRALYAEENAQYEVLVLEERLAEAQRKLSEATRLREACDNDIQTWSKMILGVTNVDDSILAPEDRVAFLRSYQVINGLT